MSLFDRIGSAGLAVLDHFVDVSPEKYAASLAIWNDNAIKIAAYEEMIKSYLFGWCGHDWFINSAMKWGFDHTGSDIHLTKYIAYDDRDRADLNRWFTERSLNSKDMTIRNQLYYPSIDECMVMYRRGLITQSLFNYMVNTQTGYQNHWANVYDNLIDEIPGPSDLIRFTVREAYNPELIEKFGYHKEFPDEVVPWMDKQGYGGTTGLLKPPGATNSDNENQAGQKATWTDLYWWAHWELPSLTQGYEMLHRLYSESPAGPSPLSNVNTKFDAPDLEMLQKAQDIPEYWRKRLAAISYHGIDKTDGAYMYESNLITRPKMYHILRNQGYNNDDTLLLLKMYDLRRIRNLGFDPTKDTLALICKYFRLGLYDRQTAERQIQTLGYSDEEAAGYLAKCMMELRGERVETIIGSIKDLYYAGETDENQTKGELIRNGLNRDIIDITVDKWKYDRDRKHKLLSFRQAVESFKNDVIDKDKLLQILLNLGYTDRSSGLIYINAKKAKEKTTSAELQKEINHRLKEQKAAITLAQKQAKQQVLQQKQIVKDQQKQVKILDNIATKRLRNFIKVSSDKNIKDWYKNKLITLQEMLIRLYAKGYSVQEAENWVRSNQIDATEKGLKDASKQAETKFKASGGYLEQQGSSPSVHSGTGKSK